MTVSEGLNSAVAAILTTETGQVFVKGLRADYPRRWTQDMEALINPYVAALSPRLLWRVQDEWDMLGFQLIKGHHASYAPGSPDLPAVTALMIVLGEIRCPDEPVKHAPHRWRSYVDDPKDLDWLEGDRLLHTDWNPLNVLITSGRGLLIDWAWPTRGAGWIDPACLIIRLIAAGHPPQDGRGHRPRRPGLAGRTHRRTRRFRPRLRPYVAGDQGQQPRRLDPAHGRRSKAVGAAPSEQDLGFPFREPCDQR